MIKLNNFQNLNFVSLASFAVYLLPFCIISGPFLPDLLVSVLSFFFIINSIKNKNFKYFNNIFFYYFLLFWFYLIISSLFSSDIYYSLKSSLPYIRHGIFFCLIFFLLNKNTKFKKYFFFSILSSTLLVAIDIFFQKIVGYNVLGFEPEFTFSMSSFFRDERIAGTFLLKVFPIVFLLNFFFLKDKINSWLVVLFYLLILPAIFYSGQRSIFYLSILFLPFLIFFYNHKFKEFLALIIFIIFLFSNIFFDKSVKVRMITDITQNIEKFDPYQYGDDEKYFLFKPLFYSPHHTVLWTTSINMFYDNKLFGIGPNLFRKKCDEYRKIETKEFDYCSTHPHNFLFQFLSELGLFGMIFYFIFFIFIFFNILISIINKITKKVLNKKLVFSFFLLLINFFPFIPNGNFFNNWLSIMNFLAIGIVIYHKYDTGLVKK